MIAFDDSINLPDKVTELLDEVIAVDEVVDDSLNLNEAIELIY